MAGRSDISWLEYKQWKDEQEPTEEEIWRNTLEARHVGKRVFPSTARAMKRTTRTRSKPKPVTIGHMPRRKKSAS